MSKFIQTSVGVPHLENFSSNIQYVWLIERLTKVVEMKSTTNGELISEMNLQLCMPLKIFKRFERECK